MSPFTEATDTMAPLPRSTMPSSTAFVIKKTARSVTESSASKSAIPVVARVGFLARAALLTRRESGPNARSASATSLGAVASSATSASIATPVRPSAAISLTTACAASASISATATAAPSRARRSAVARPMPRPAPVTSAVLPMKRLMLQIPSRVSDRAEPRRGRPGRSGPPAARCCPSAPVALMLRRYIRRQAGKGRTQ